MSENQGARLRKPLGLILKYDTLDSFHNVDSTLTTDERKNLATQLHSIDNYGIIGSVFGFGTGLATAAFFGIQLRKALVRANKAPGIGVFTVTFLNFFVFTFAGYGLGNAAASSYGFNSKIKENYANGFDKGATILKILKDRATGTWAAYYAETAANSRLAPEIALAIKRQIDLKNSNSSFPSTNNLQSPPAVAVTPSATVSIWDRIDLGKAFSNSNSVDNTYEFVIVRPSHPINSTKSDVFISDIDADRADTAKIFSSEEKKSDATENSNNSFFISAENAEKQGKDAPDDFNQSEKKWS